MLSSALLFLLLNLPGCGMMNPYVFIIKKELPSTPDKSHLPYQEVWFSTPDGVELNGWLVPGAPEKPLVLYFHGNAGNLSDTLDYLTLLHRFGFSVFMFDYRGYGNSDGAPFRENDLYQDARGALNYLAEQGWPQQRIIFFGQSLGAAVALQMALESRPAGLVLEGAFTSMREMVRHVAPLAYYTVAWWGIRLGFDNLAKINRVEVPLLLIHGERDQTVPVEMTRRLFARAAGPKSLLIIKGGGHCDAFTRDSTVYAAAWSSYLKAILPQKAATRLGVRP